jgi:hypothetical protein
MATEMEKYGDRNSRSLGISSGLAACTYKRACDMVPDVYRR